jgi:hypothetical protein
MRLWLLHYYIPSQLFKNKLKLTEEIEQFFLLISSYFNCYEFDWEKGFSKMMWLLAAPALQHWLSYCNICTLEYIRKNAGIDCMMGIAL